MSDLASRLGALMQPCLIHLWSNTFDTEILSAGLVLSIEVMRSRTSEVSQVGNIYFPI